MTGEIAKGIRLLPGDMREVLASLEPESVDSCVCDPPYHLTANKKGGSGVASVNLESPYGRSRIGTGNGLGGFMGKAWDGGEIAFEPETWAAVYRVLKPGGHLLAFGAPKNFGFMQVAIANAGFEVRDVLCYMFGSGFPKSHDPKKGAGPTICRCASSDRDVSGVWDTDENSARMAQAEQECLLQSVMPSEGTRRTFDSVREQLKGQEEPSEGPEWSAQCCMEGRRDIPEAPRQLREREVRPLPGGHESNGKSGRLCDGAQASDGVLGRQDAHQDGMCASQGPSAAKQRQREFRTVAGQPEPQVGGALPNCGRCGKPIFPDGLGTALKPAYEPIIMARKPLIGTVAQNVMEHGTGAINVDGCRVSFENDAPNPATNPLYRLQGGYRHAGNDDSGSNNYSVKGRGEPSIAKPEGRWPANVVHDGSEEVRAGFPETMPSSATAGVVRNGRSGGIMGKVGALRDGRPEGHDDPGGSAARFFYTAKADSDDRLGSKHPTVKPVDLMQWLVRLVTPKGGLVLDPFAGTGTTGEAAFREGMRAILIEREEEYQADIRRRMQLCLAGPDERRRETIKHKTKDSPADHGPLFSDWESMWDRPLAETNPDYSE